MGSSKENNIVIRSAPGTLERHKITNLTHGLRLNTFLAVEKFFLDGQLINTLGKKTANNNKSLNGFNFLFQPLSQAGVKTLSELI